jgi:hypothetical protein
LDIIIFEYIVLNFRDQIERKTASQKFQILFNPSLGNLTYYYILRTRRAEDLWGCPIGSNERWFFMFASKLIVWLFESLFRFIPVVIYKTSLIFYFFFYDGFHIIPKIWSLTISLRIKVLVVESKI